MKLNFSGRVLTAFAALTLLACSAPSAFGQEEGVPVVVDEVIAQVNGEVITLSMVKRASKEAIESGKQQGMSEQQVTDEVMRNQPQLIARLINEQLLLQRGKELELASDVEAEVNRRMLAVAKEQGIETIADLEKALNDQGLSPADIRQTLRTEIMKNAVMQREVDAKIYYGLTDDELKKYFSAHPDKFRKPESVTLSEIFLSLAGKPEAEVRAKALGLVAQLRGGGDFGAAASANSEREQGGVRVATQSKGKVGTFQVPNLRADLAAALKNVKAGGVTDPVRTDEGYQILRVDERTPGGDTPTFNENQVREAVTAERADKARVEYLQTLLNDAYIKVAEGYRATVMPLLKLNAAPTAAATAPTKNSGTPNSASGTDKKAATNGSRRP